MKKILTGILITFFIILIFGTCDDPSAAPAGKTKGTDDGSTEALPIPGGDWRTTDDITPVDKFKLYAMIDLDPEEATTQATFGLWEDNKFHVEGYAIGSGKLDSTGWADVCYLYYDRLFENNEDFTISVRVRLTTVQSLSSAKGAYVCAIAPENADEVRSGMTPLIAPSTSAIGTLVRSSYTGGATTAGIIPYRRTATNAWDARTSDYLRQGPDAHWKTEYIYVLSRNQTSYFFMLMDSKTGNLISSYRVNHDRSGAAAFNTTSMASEAPGFPGATQLHNDIRPGGKPLLLGVALLGAAAEISNVQVWNQAITGASPNLFALPDTEAEFATPSAKAAYVAVDIMRINDTIPKTSAAQPPNPNPTNLNPPPPDYYPYDFQFTYAVATINAAGGKITLIPEFTPVSADNLWVSWIMLDGSDAGFSITGSSPSVIKGDGIVGLDGKDYTGFTRGEITVPAGGGTGYFLGYSYDPRLDDGVTGSDYPLKQTMAEYRFSVRVQ